MNEPQSNSNYLSRVLNSKHTQQTSILFGSQILVLLFGVALKTIQTRNLTIEEYGLYALFGSITSFLAIFFRFGYFSSLKVLLAGEEDSYKSRELIGTGIIIASIIGLLFSITLVILSFFADSIFNVKIGQLLLVFSPLCVIIPFKLFIQEIGIGANKIGTVAFFESFSVGVFLVSILALLTIQSISIPILISTSLSAVILSVLITLKTLQPKFSNVGQNLQIIQVKNREFGLNYYSGAIVNQSTYKLDELFISYFVNVSQLGFYTLANLICSPMSYMSSALSKSLFKKMHSMDSIPKKVIFINMTWLLGCIVFLYFTSNWIVTFLFGKGYEFTALYIIPLSFAHFFQGMYAPYSFLAAKSKGREIRNVAYAEAATNIIGNIILIPTYGVYGAITSSILARFLHFIMLHFYYTRYKNGDKRS